MNKNQDANIKNCVVCNKKHEINSDECYLVILKNKTTCICVNEECWSNYCKKQIEAKYTLDSRVLQNPNIGVFIEPKLNNGDIVC